MKKAFTHTPIFRKSAYAELVRGFTLVEIMVVVGVIAILATLAIPMMLRNRIVSNETVAIASCRTIVSACQSYHSINLPHAYPPDLQSLGTGGGGVPAYIDDVLSTPPYKRTGYRLIYLYTDEESFKLYAGPVHPGRTGNRYFYTDETGRITAKEGSRAGPGDPAV